MDFTFWIFIQICLQTIWYINLEPMDASDVIVGNSKTFFERVANDEQGMHSTGCVASLSLLFLAESVAHIGGIWLDVGWHYLEQSHVSRAEGYNAEAWPNLHVGQMSSNLASAMMPRWKRDLHQSL